MLRTRLNLFIHVNFHVHVCELILCLHEIRECNVIMYKCTEVFAQVFIVEYFSLCTFSTVLFLTGGVPGVLDSVGLDMLCYVVLLVMPVLGSMSDQQQHVRVMASQCFANLVTLMPLEVFTTDCLGSRVHVHLYTVVFF